MRNSDVVQRISYVGIIIVRRAEQPEKALFDIVTKEVGRITLTRAEQPEKARSDIVTRVVGRNILVSLELPTKET